MARFFTIYPQYLVHAKESRDTSPKFPQNWERTKNCSSIAHAPPSQKFTKLKNSLSNFSIVYLTF